MKARAVLGAGLLVLLMASAGCGTNASHVASVLRADPESTRAAEADVQAALPSVEAYFADHASYVGMTVDSLRTYDPGISSTVSVHDAGPSSFCLESSVRGEVASVTGAAGAPTDSPCP